MENDERTDMQRVTLGKGGSVVTWSDGYSIFHRQFGEKNEKSAIFEYILTAVQSFGSQDDNTKSLIMILGVAGVSFCENEKTLIKWTTVCSKENTYLDMQEARRGLREIGDKRVLQHS